VLPLTALLAGCSAAAPAATGPASTTAAFHGTEPDRAGPRPSFQLTDTSGAAYDFGVKTRGRPTLLYFGYTNCPDECPTAMADIAAALRQSSRDVRERVVVVFVTTDPERDDPALLRRWLDQFSTDAVGLTGTTAEVAAAQRTMGIAPAGRSEGVATLPGRPDEHEHAPGTAPHTHLGPLGYGVEHRDVIFAFDTADRQPVLYPGGTRPSDIAADLPLLVQGVAS
jgi:protein SCO1/2